MYATMKQTRSLAATFSGVFGILVCFLLQNYLHGMYLAEMFYLVAATYHQEPLVQ